MGSYCHRKYIGTWEIVNNVLYLAGIKFNYYKEDEEKLKPLLIDDVICQATWYSGMLITALVESTFYHFAYLQIYTEEMHFTVEDGLITNHEIVENEIPEVEEEEDDLPF